MAFKFQRQSKTKWKWKSILKFWIIYFFLALLIDCGCLVVLNWLEIFSSLNGFQLKKIIFFDWKILFRKYLFLLLGLQILLFFCSWGLAFYTVLKNQKKKNFISYEQNNKEFGISEFLIDERKIVQKNNLDKFNKVYSQKQDNPFWLVRSVFDEKQQRLIFSGLSVEQAVHSLIIGTTGSGKTQKIIVPNAILNARLSKDNKPSMVFSDPKGELLELLSGELKDQGYKIHKLNFRNVMDSIQYNPLNSAWNFFEQSLNYPENINKTNIQDFRRILKTSEFKCYIHNLVSCMECLNLKNDEIFWDKTNNIFFIDQAMKNNYLKHCQRELKNKAFDEVSDLTDMLYDEGNESQNASWFQGAKGLIKGLILLFLELKELGIAIKKHQFNIINITKLLANQSILINWFKKYGEKNKTSGSWSAVSGVINASEQTRSNYFSVAMTRLKMFEDESMKELLADNDLDLTEFANKNQPQALFLIVPDDRTDKHPLAALFISQLYKALTATATKNIIKKGKDELDRTVLFFLDEFGNFPKILNFENMITVARSRRIFFSLVIQDFQQL